jgi:hypothetical protein
MPSARGALDTAIKRELARFTEGDQEAYLRDFLAKREHRVWGQHTLQSS